MPKIFVAGALAAVCAKSFVAPLDRTKLLYSTKNPYYKNMNMFQIFKSIYVQEGLRGYYKGNLIQLIRMIPYGGLQFTIFEYSHEIIKKKTNNSRFAPLYAGILQTFAGQFFLYPFDLLRTRFSSQHNNEMIYKNILTSIKKIYKKDGFRGFYSGLGVSLLGVVPYGGIGFFSYYELKKNFSDNSGINGSLSGLIGQTLTYPFDVIRKRIQLNSFIEGNEYKSNILEVFKHILKTDGFIGFFRGVHMNWIRVIPASGISWTVYETIKYSKLNI
jgi:hypothetical protein